MSVSRRNGTVTGTTTQPERCLIIWPRDGPVPMRTRSTSEFVSVMDVFGLKGASTAAA